MNEIQRSTQTLNPPRSATTSKLSVVILSLTALWSTLMLVVSALWGSGVLAAPFGNPEPNRYSSLLDQMSVPVGAGLIGFCALLSLVFVALLLTLPRLRATAVGMVGAFAFLLSLITTVVFTDTLLLAYIGYTLSLQFPPIPGPVVWQAVLMVGPGLWLAAWASLEAGRRRQLKETDDHSVDAKRSADSFGSSPVVTTSAKIAVGAAVAVPVIYGTTRILWAVGIPFGLRAQDYTEGVRVGMWHSGLALAIAGIMGALLTLGLVQKWGERLPRWTGPLAGRRVPILLATIPATIVALALFTGGMGLIRAVLAGGVGLEHNWVTIGPTLLFPLWALALGWATYAYRARRLASESGKSKGAETRVGARSSASAV